MMVIGRACVCEQRESRAGLESPGKAKLGRESSLWKRKKKRRKFMPWKKEKRTGLPAAAFFSYIIPRAERREKKKRANQQRTPEMSGDQSISRRPRNTHTCTTTPSHHQALRDTTGIVGATGAGGGGGGRRFPKYIDPMDVSSLSLSPFQTRQSTS